MRLQRSQRGAVLAVVRGNSHGTIPGTAFRPSYWNRTMTWSSRSYWPLAQPVSSVAWVGQWFTTIANPDQSESMPTRDRVPRNRSGPGTPEARGFPRLQREPPVRRGRWARNGGTPFLRCLWNSRGRSIRMQPETMSDADRHALARRHEMLYAVDGGSRVDDGEARLDGPPCQRGAAPARRIRRRARLHRHVLDDMPCDPFGPSPVVAAILEGAVSDDLGRLLEVEDLSLIHI